MQRRQLVCTVAATLAAAPLALLPSRAWAAYPERPVVLVVPFPPGGPADGYGRAFAQALSLQLKQTVVVENRAGVGGALGVQSVARSAPDGYTLGIAGGGALVFLPLLMEKDKLLFDTFKDLSLLSRMVSTPNILVAGPRVSARTVQELIQQAKAQPGKFAIASAGAGTSTHILAELFKQKAGVDMLHVPYKGATPALLDLMGGQVDVFFVETPGALPYIKSGKVRALFTTATKRASWLPDVPSALEVGLPDVIAEGMYGVVGPAGLTDAVSKQLGAAIDAALKSPELASRFDQFAGVPVPSSSAAFSAYLKGESERWLPVIRKGNIVLE
jgi:tripartite-type tricarboxylate transporter receptor subunit TctC